MRCFTFLIFVLIMFSLKISAHCQVVAPPTTTPAPEVAPPPILNYRGLNPAFLLTASDVDKAVYKGQTLAKKGVKAQDVLKDNTQQPVGVKGEKGKSRDSIVTWVNSNGGDFVFPAYLAATNYEPLPPRKPSGVFESDIIFFVMLKSVPSVKHSIFHHDRGADQDDVTVTKFVLTDDKGEVFFPENTRSVGGVQSGMDHFSGMHQIQHNDTDNVQVNTNSTTYPPAGYGYSPATTSGTAAGTVTHTWTEVIPWSEDHPFYSATYNVQFPLFGADGQPLIKADVKTITLHMITPNGEKDVTYDLKPPRI